MSEEALQQFRKERADLLLDVLRELELAVLESVLEGCFNEAVALEIQALHLKSSRRVDYRSITPTGRHRARGGRRVAKEDEYDRGPAHHRSHPVFAAADGGASQTATESGTESHLSHGIYHLKCLFLSLFIISN